MGPQDKPWDYGTTGQWNYGINYGIAGQWDSRTNYKTALITGYTVVLLPMGQTMGSQDNGTMG